MIFYPLVDGFSGSLVCVAAMTTILPVAGSISTLPGSMLPLRALLIARNIGNFEGDQCAGHFGLLPPFQPPRFQKDS
ncbi:hypothetical protein [Mesorhizobium sp. M0772]|uniref:hypothetical protein n=1 Tax=Mesorhizobium sp. M0772 TaxID=2956998 RepID=UPI00333D10EC